MSDEQQMLQSHRKTWQSFCRLLTWSLAGVVLTILLMWIFLV